MCAAKATAIAIVGWLSAITGAIAADEHSFMLEVLWSTPIAAFPLSRPAGTPYNPGSEPGTVFEAQAIYPDGRIVFLGSRIIGGKRVMALFADPEHDPSNHAIVLALNGAHPLNLHLSSRVFGAGPRPLTLAAGASGKMWVGGRSNSFMDLASGDHSDAYLAEIDADGKTLWEKAYGSGGLRQIRNAISLPAGEVVVAGDDAGKGWLARIGPDGSQLWERHLGIAKSNAIVSLPGRSPCCCWLRDDRLKFQQRLSRTHCGLDRRRVGRNSVADPRQECHQHGFWQLFRTCFDRCDERCDLHYLKLEGVSSHSTDRGLQTGSGWRTSLDHFVARQQCEGGADARRQPGGRRICCLRP